MKKTNDTNDTTTPDEQIVRTVTNYKQEANAACLDRMLQNLENFDTYHMKQNFDHKRKGQSKEFLAKQFMAVEQIASFIKQGLIDLGTEWYSLDYSEGVENPLITKDVIKKLLDRQMIKADFYGAVEDALKCGLLGSLMIWKVDGEWVTKPKYTAVEVQYATAAPKQRLRMTKDKVWQLKLSVVSTLNFRPDPTGRGLYKLEDMEMDMHDIRAMVKSSSNPKGIYDAEAVEALASDISDTEKKFKESRMSGQNMVVNTFRKRVKITECWGTIIDDDGNVIHENIVCAVANDKFLIRKPQKNPFWHQQDPYVVTPIVRVPHSVWHKALMDAPTKHNKALNEIYNLTLDSGIMSVFGVKQLRTDWLQDATVVDDGIYPGQTIEVNSQCPPGAKVLERVDTADMSAEAIQVYNLTNAEFQQSAMTNDLRLGVLPSRQVKATEIVESSQSITGMLNGVAKSIESKGITPLLAKSWMNIVQHVEDFDEVEVQKLLGPNIAAQVKALSRERRFADTVNGLTFQVFGITNTLNKQKDFRRITALLQTIAGNEVLIEAFAQQYSFPKLLTEIIKSLDVNVEKIKLDESEKAQIEQAQAQQPQGPGQSPSASAGSGAAPDTQSQIPQAASAESGPIPNAHFPPGRATSGLGNGPAQ